MKFKHLSILFVVVCLISPTTTFASNEAEELLLKTRPIKIPHGKELEDQAATHLLRWIDTCDCLRNRMIVSIDLIREAKQDSSGHSIGELNSKEQNNICNLESLSKELSFLTVKSILDVFCKPIYQTGLSGVGMHLINEKLSSRFELGFQDSFEVRKVESFVALKFPFNNFSFGRQWRYSQSQLHLKTHNKIRYECVSRHKDVYTAPADINKTYYKIVSERNPDLSLLSIEDHLNYDVIHMCKPEDMVFWDDVQEPHFRPQIYLERVRMLSKKILQYYAGPYWHGVDVVTPEIAHHLMLKLNDKCNDFQCDLKLKGNLMLTIHAIEAALKLPTLFEEAFYNSQCVRFDLVDTLKTQ